MRIDWEPVLNDCLDAASESDTGVNVVRLKAAQRVPEVGDGSSDLLHRRRSFVLTFF